MRTETTTRLRRPRHRRLGWLFERTHRPDASERLFEPPGWLWTRAGDVGWWVRADWQESLLGPDGLRLDRWQIEDRLRIVKSGPLRVVYRVELPQGVVFIKHFLVPGLQAKLRQWFRRGKGRNEGRRTRDLAAIGVPTITPIALGEQRKRLFLFENYLITPEVPDAVPLNQFVEQHLPRWPLPRQARMRQDLAVALASMTARLHNAGFVHQDFHPGNILVQIDDRDQPRLTMIDLDALRFSFPLDWPEAQHNLALLNHYFWLRSNRSDRYRFLRNYLRARRATDSGVPSQPPTGSETRRRPRRLRRFAQGIEDATRVWAERLWRRWGRRCRGSNKYFRTASGPGCRAVVARNLDPAEVRTLLDDPDIPLAHPATVLLKDSRSATVGDLVLNVDGRPQRVIYKRFNHTKWYDPFLTLFRPTPAWQSWQAGQHLACRAIPTPRNLAYIARRRPLGRSLFWYLPHETYLITLKEEAAITLGDYVHRVLPTLEPDVQRARVEALTLALARLLRSLHERSLSNRDMKASNLLLVGPADDPSPTLTMIDLDGVRLIHPLPRHRRVQNLARLSVSLATAAGRTRTDALRFLRAYLPWGLSPRNDWKGLWRAIAARSQAKVERNKRHGRRLS
jgi:serine/threonine protein kinase